MLKLQAQSSKVQRSTRLQTPRANGHRCDATARRILRPALFGAWCLKFSCGLGLEEWSFALRFAASLTAALKTGVCA
jgi:hypothetical protein